MRSRRFPFARPGRSDAVVRVVLPEGGGGPGTRAAEGLDDGPGRWHALPCGAADPASFRTVRIRRDGGVIDLGGLSGPGRLVPLALRRALPFALALRGHVVLHASAVEAAGEAFAFVGASGAGKSTLARELGALGWRVLCDDLLRVEAGGLRVRVAAPSAGGRHVRWLPLRRVLFLSRGEEAAAPAVRSLAAVEFLGHLVRHGFGELGTPEVRALQLAVYHRLVLAAEGALLALPEAPGEVPSMVRAVASLLRLPHGGRGRLEPPGRQREA